MGFEQEYVFTVRIKNIFCYFCTNVLRMQSKYGSASFKCFWDVTEQKLSHYFLFLPGTSSSWIPLFSHISVSNTLLLSTNLIWRSEENLYSGLGFFFKWWIFCYSGTEGSSPPKASQTLFAVKDLPCCHGGEHPPQEHHSFQQGSPGTDTSVSLCLIKTKLSQHYEVKYNTKEKTI